MSELISSLDLAIPKGSLILVTGATGYVASHIVNEFLALGYKVRGAARNEEKAARTHKLWAKYGSSNYETVIVPDMSVDGAFDEAVNGVSAVVHVASVLSFDKDPNNVVPQTVAGTMTALKAAAKEESVKRFVYTSSSVAATLPKPNTKFHIDSKTWNDEGVQNAWAPPPYEEERAWAVYAASKTESEKAIWKFVKEEKPKFVVNTVCPNANIGTILDKTQARSTGEWALNLFRSKGLDDMRAIPPQWFINTRDDGRLHVAATIDTSVQNERIFAFAEPFNWNDILASIRELRPDNKVPDDFPDLPRDLSTVDNALGKELLKKWWGQDGYTSLKQSVKENLEGF